MDEQPIDAHPKGIRAVIKDSSDHWRTLYSVDAKLSSLLELFEEKPAEKR